MTRQRPDNNSERIVTAFREMGFSYLDTSQLRNCCDGFAAKRGFSIAIEIKNPDNPPSKQRLSSGEADFKNRWAGWWELVMHVEDVEKIDLMIAKKAYNCSRGNR